MKRRVMLCELCCQTPNMMRVAMSGGELSPELIRCETLESGRIVYRCKHLTRYDIDIPEVEMP